MANANYTIKVSLDSNELSADLRKMAQSFGALEQELVRMAEGIIKKFTELTGQLKNIMPDTKHVKTAGDVFRNDLIKSLNPVKIVSGIASGTIAELLKKPFKDLFDDRFKDNLKNAFTGIGTTITAGLEETVQQATIGLNMYKDGLVTNFKSMKDKVIEVFGDMKERMVEIFGTVKENVITTFGTIQEKVTTHFTEIKEKVVSGFGTIKTQVAAAFAEIKAKVATTFAYIKTKIAAAFVTFKAKIAAGFAKLKAFIAPKLLALLGPKGLILAAIIALVVLIVKNWDAIKEAAINVWNAITDFVGRAVDVIRNVFSSVVDWFSDNWQAILLFVVNPFAGAFKLLYDNFEGFRDFVDGFVEAIGDFFKNLWEGVQNAASAAWDFIKGIWEVVTGWFDDNVITPITDLFSVVWEFIGTAASNAWEGIQNVWNTVANWFSDTIITPIRDAFDIMWEGISNVASTVWDTISNTVRGGANAVLTTIEGVINGAISAVNRGIGAIANAINSIRVEIPDWVPGIGGNGLGFNIQSPQIPNISIPRLAKGAVIDPNDSFLAILGDQRHGKNIEAPLSTIEDAVSNVFHSISATAANPFNSLAIAAMTSSGGRMGSGAVRLDNNSIVAIVNGISQSFATSLSDYMAEGAASGNDLVLELDGRELARASWEGLANEAGRRGVRFAY